MFYDVTDETRKLGEELVAWSLNRFAGEGLEAQKFSLTWLPFGQTLTPENSGEKPTGYSYHGDRLFYPCSVVKAFYLAAAEARLEEGVIEPHEELDRAMRDMILWSSNMATNYIIDLVTGTTGDTLLGDAEMAAWVQKRNWVNGYYDNLSWPEAAGINVCQKLMDDDRYGREKIFVRFGGNNHNRLSSDATARLYHAIFTGTLINGKRSRHMADLLKRRFDPEFAALPAAQVQGYFGAGLPQGAALWSKAGHTGWTGDEMASYRRHDSAYVELPNGRSFILAVFTEGKAMSDSMTVLPGIAGKACALLT